MATMNERKMPGGSLGGLCGGWRHDFAGEAFGPIDFGGGDHEDAECRNRPDRDGESGKSVEEEAVGDMKP
jgi:hypothetical protein